MTTPYDDLILACANNYGLPFALLQAQVMTESSGDPNAFRYEHAYFERYILGNANAKAGQYGPFAACSVGLLQIMVETACEIGFTDRPERLFDPRIGLAFGCKRMQGLLAAAGGPSFYRVALAAYNGGPKLLHIPESAWPPSVQAYVDKVYSLVNA
jgi:soluble lytic murein transglycosylase-like protein